MFMMIRRSRGRTPRIANAHATTPPQIAELREHRHLLAPRIRGFGEAVEHQDEGVGLRIAAHLHFESPAAGFDELGIDGVVHRANVAGFYYFGAIVKNHS